MQKRKKQQSDFRKRRQQFSLNLRKINREQIFHKKREQPLDDQIHETNYVIDQRYEQYIRTFIKTRFHVETLQELVEGAYSDDIVKKHYGIIGIRKIMSISDDPPIQAIIDAGLVPKLIQYVQQDQYPQLQLQSTWALANVSAGTHQQCQSIVDKGVVPLFIRLLKSKYGGIVQQAIWAVGNIATDSNLSRDAVIRTGGVQNLIYAIKNAQNSYILDHGLWALSNLCRGKPLPQYNCIKQGIMVLGQTIVNQQIKDPNILNDCIWGICYNTKCDQQKIENLLRVNFHKAIVPLLKYQESSVLIGCTRILARMTSGNSKQLGMIMNQSQLLDILTDLVGHQKKIIRAEICWVISNIAAGGPQYIQEILKRDHLIAMLLNIFETDSSEVRDEICYLFSNMAKEGEPEVVFKFFKQVNIMKFYMLQLSNQDSKLVNTALSQLCEILKFGERFRETGKQNPFTIDILNLGGATTLEELQMHQERSIYNKTLEIVETYFDHEDPLNF